MRYAADADAYADAQANVYAADAADAYTADAYAADAYDADADINAADDEGEEGE